MIAAVQTTGVGGRESNCLNLNADCVSLPAVSTAERLALGLSSGDRGTLVYDNDLGVPFVWSGSEWIEGASLNPSAANTQVLFRDGNQVSGDPSLTWDKSSDLLTTGVDSTTAVAARRQRIFGSVRVEAGTNNPNAAELRVIGPMVPYHNLQIINGLTNGFASNSDHTHAQWLNFASGNAQSRQLGQVIYTANSSGTSMAMHGGPTSALGTLFGNEHSIDTTDTVQTPAAPAYIGRVKLRYTSNPGIALGETLLLQIITIQVSGIQAAVYTATSATASALVGGLWEVQIDVEGLDPLHWNWNNRSNNTSQNDNWQLNRLITPLANLTKLEAVAGDSTAVKATFSALPAGVAVGVQCSVMVRAGSTLSGLTTYFLNCGYISEVSGLTATVRLRNMRYRNWFNISGSDTDPSRFDLYLGIRDVAHDLPSSHCAVVQYRNSSGVPTCHIFGPSDVGSTVDRTVVVGRNLVARNSDEWVAGTDDTSNRMALRNNVLSVPGIQFDATGEVLGDYEEGTFTPDIQDIGAGRTFTWFANGGSYVRIGKTVFFRVQAVCDSASGASLDETFFNLPFAPASIATATVLGRSLSASAKTQLVAGILLNGIGGGTLHHYENGDINPLGQHIQAGSSITITGTYLTT